MKYLLSLVFVFSLIASQEEPAKPFLFTEVDAPHGGIAKFIDLEHISDFDGFSAIYRDGAGFSVPKLPLLHHYHSKAIFSPCWLRLGNTCYDRLPEPVAACAGEKASAHIYVVFQSEPKDDRPKEKNSHCVLIRPDYWLHPGATSKGCKQNTRVNCFVMDVDNPAVRLHGGPGFNAHTHPGAGGFSIISPDDKQLHGLESPYTQALWSVIEVNQGGHAYNRHRAITLHLLVNDADMLLFEEALKVVDSLPDLLEEMDKSDLKRLSFQARLRELLNL